MNKIFKVIWSKSKQCYIVVSEMAKNHSGKKKIVVASILAAMAVGGALNVSASTYKWGADSYAAPEAIALGDNTHSGSGGSIALGHNAAAQGTDFKPEGATKSTNDPSIAIGKNASAEGNASVSIGYKAVIDKKSYAVAVGREAEAEGDYGVSLGYNTRSARDGTAVGEQARSKKRGATVLGVSSRGYGNGAIAVGWQALAGADVYTAGVPGSDINNDSSSKINEYNKWGDMSVGLRAMATGGNATALGRNAAATAANAVAIGGGNGDSFNDNTERTQATAEKAVAIGYKALASDKNATSIGTDAQASKVRSTAIGYEVRATGNNAVAIGSSDKDSRKVVAAGESAIAIGTKAQANNDSSTAIGKETIAGKNNAIALGTSAQGTGESSTAIGKSAQAQKSDAIALGTNTEASEERAVAIGKGATAEKVDAVALGTSATSGGANGVAIGNDAQAQAADTIAVGSTSRAENVNDSAFGNAAKASGGGSTAIGYIVKTSGNQAFGAGSNSNVSGTAAIGIGYKVTASGNRSISIGNDNGNIQTEATGEKAIAIGSGVQSTGSASTAIGKGAIANQNNAFAAGTEAKAQATDTVAIGSGVTASGLQSISIGSTFNNRANQATGIASLAIGSGAQSTGAGSVAVGRNVQSLREYTTAIGTNITASNEASASTIIGYNSATKGNQSVNIGSTNTTEETAQYSTAIGYKTNVSGMNAIAIGSGDGGQNSGNVIASADNAIAIGTKTKASAASAMALGSNANAALAHSVALGEGSTTTEADGASKTAYLTGESTNNSGNGVISVGNKRNASDTGTITRRIVSVASGTDDYDAVNVKQFKALESNEWLLRTQNAGDANPTDVEPQTVNGQIKKRVTLKAGDNITVSNSNGVVTLNVTNVVKTVTSGNTAALTVNNNNGAVTITPNIASSVGAANEDNKLVTSGKVKTALDAKIDKTAEMHIKSGEYTVNPDGTASLIQQNGNNQDQSTRVTIKDIAKKSVVDTLQSDYNTFKMKAITFTGDDNQGVARTLDTTLTVKGGANYTSTTTNTNIHVEKDATNGANGLLVKLSDKLSGMKEIAGTGSQDLVIKNGNTTVTVKAPANGDTGTVDFGKAKVVAPNLDASIKYRANDDAVGKAKSVKLADGFNFVASKDATTTAEGPKAGLAIKAEDNGKVTFGLDKATREKVDNAADKNLSNLSDDGKNKVKELAKTAAQDAVKVAAGTNTTVEKDTTTTAGVTTYKVNANDTTVAVTGDGLAISGGDLGTDKVRKYSLDLSAATKGKLAAIGNIATNVIGGTTIGADGTVTGPTFSITKADGTAENAGTIKEAIEKLDAANKGQNTKISDTAEKVTNLATALGGGAKVNNDGSFTGPTYNITKANGTGTEAASNVGDAISKLDTRITTANGALVTKGLDFTGNDTTAKVHRDLGTTLTIKGAENFTRAATETNNIKVVKNGDALDVKLAENLAKMKEISGDGSSDLVIKNGDTKVTVKAPANGDKGTVDFGDAKVIAKNLDTSIAYKSNQDTAKKTVKLQDGFNFTTATDTTTTAEGPKSGLAITTGDNGVVTFGLDKATREKVDNAADKNLSNLSDDGKNKVKELAKGAAQDAVKVADGINTTVTTDTTTTTGVTTYKVNANDTTVAVTGNGLTISGGELGTDKVRKYSLDLSDATKGKLKAVGGLSTVIGGTNITADGTVTGPTFSITKADGTAENAGTIKEAIEKLDAANKGQNTKISDTAEKVTNLATALGGGAKVENGTFTGPTYNITKADGSGTETASNVGDAISKLDTRITTANGALVTKGLDFTGNDTTAKVHRDLGTTLTIKGAENFTRAATETNNIKVVKNGDALDVKLAENLAKMKEISGDGASDLVIKNGDTKVTVKAPTSGDTGTVDFGKAKVVAPNLDASISYKAGNGDTKKTVKLQDGFNFTTATDTTTTAEGPKAGLAITAEDNGKVTFGLDKATREKVDNAADKNLSNLSDDGKNKVKELAKGAAQDAVKVADGINTTVTTDTTTTAGVTTYKVNANDTTVAVTGDGLAINGGDLGTDKVRKYSLDLSAATKGKLAAVGNIATNVIGGTTIGADGTVTGPTFSITKTDGTAENAGTIKEAIEKLDAANKGQNTKISDTAEKVTNLATALGGGAKVENGTFTGPTYNITKADGTGTETASNVGDAISKLDTRITTANGALVTKGLDFTGNDTTAKVHRDLGTTLTIKGAENFTRAAAENNIKVVKNGDALDVKLAENLAKMKEISGDGASDLVIKNGDTKVTVKAPANGDKGTVDFGDAKVIAKNLDTSIAYKSNQDTAKKTVKLQDGFNFTTATDTTTTAEGPKSGLAITTGDNGVVTFGLDKATREKVNNAADKNLSNLSDDGKNKVKELAKGAAQDAVKVADGINTTVTTDTTTTTGVTTYKVNANDTTVAVTGDGLAITGGDLGADKVRKYSLDLSAATKGKLAAVGNLATNVIGGTTVNADGTVVGPTFSITKADGTNETANTLKDAIDKLNATNAGQNTKISETAGKVTTLEGKLDGIVDKGMTFAGDHATADKVTRKLGETLNIHGQNNITVKKDATAEDTLNVKLASDLKNITSITNADADGKPGSKITLGADGVSITNTAAGDTKTVTIGKDGINAGGMKITNVAKATKNGDAANKEYVDEAISNLGNIVSGNATLNFAGNVTKNAQDKATEKVGLSLATGTLHVNGAENEITTTAKGDTITVGLAETVKAQLAKVGDTASNGRDGVNGTSGAQGLTGKDGLNDKTLTEKVNALRNGEAGSVVYTDENGARLVKAKDGEYYKAADVDKDGNVLNGAQKATTVEARVVNPDGTTTGGTIKLSNIADGKVAAGSKDAVNGGQLHTVKSDLATALGGDSKVNADGSFTGPTYNITKDDGSNTKEAVNNVGDAISKLDGRINNVNTVLGNKGLDFYGNKDTADTDKVHRNLGEALKVKGAENFIREANAKNNIDVVKNTAGDGFDVKLAENLGNIKEITGNGKDNLVIKNGDATITLKPKKDAEGTNPATPATVDFGDTKVVASNLDASIKYRANDEDVANAKSVKLADGFNFVASKDATTTAEGPKSGLAITTGDNGVVTFGLDKATREKVDNAADKNLSNLSDDGKNKVKELAKGAAQDAVKVADGINTTVTTDTTTTTGVTTYKVNANDTTVAVNADTLAISGGDLDATTKVRAYTLDLSNTVKAKLNAINNVGDTASNGRDGVNGTSGATGLTGKDGLNNKTLTDKVNALRNGEAGSVVYTDENGARLVKAKDGQYYKAADVDKDGNVLNNANPATTVEARVVNPDGTTTGGTTKLSNIADGKVAVGSKDAVNGGQLHTVKSDLATALGGDSKVNTDGSFTGPTYSITKDDGSNTKEAVNNVGDAISKLDGRINNANTALGNKGLDFYGNKDAADTDKVHRNLGEALKVKGAENFTREANAKNNIDVVKNTAGDGFDVKLAENLANMKEISGNGKDNLVIKNGDATITLKPKKEAEGTNPATPATVDFGNTKVVASNLDASIKYRANDEEAAKAKSVKLADGFNFVASNVTDTAAEGPKSGLAITAEDNGKVTFGLDKATRSTIDNAADKDLSNLTDTGKTTVKELAKGAAQDAVKVANGINTTVEKDTATAGVTTYKVNANDTTVAVTGDGLTISGGDLGTDKVRKYSLDLSAATKGKLAAVGNLATNVIGGTTIGADGTVTGPTFNITKADGTTEEATTIKDAIDKLNATNAGQNTKISETAGKVTTLEGKVDGIVEKGMVFAGDDAAADKVTRKLGETLNIHGQNNITVKKDGTAADTLNVKLASELKNITSITNADADGKPGSKITLGADGVSIANTAAGADGAAGETKTVTIGKDGINAGGMKVTNVAKAEADGDVANKKYVDDAISNLDTTIRGNATLNFAGNETKDAQDKATEKVGLSLATGTLHVNGANNEITTTAKGDTITVGLAETVKAQLAKVGDTASNGRDGKDGTSGAQGLTGKDGLNDKTLTEKVNALRNGEAGSVVYTDENGARLVKAKDGEYYKAADVDKDGNVLNGAQKATTVEARVVNPDGTTTGGTTKLSNIADGKVAAGSKDAVNGGQLHTAKSDLATALGGGAKVNNDGSFTGPTYNITKADGTGTEEVKNVGDAISKLDGRINNANTTLGNKGLDFYGNKDTADTDKVHRNLGEALKVKGAENFTREANTKNNIDVVKNTAGDGFDVKLAENLGNIKSISNATGAGKPGSTITLGADGVSIANTAAGADGAAGETKTVTIGKDGINAGGMKVTNVAKAEVDGDAANKKYVDDAITNLNTTVTNNANLRYAGDTNEGAAPGADHLNLPLATGTLKVAGTADQIKTVANSGTITLSLDEKVTNKLAKLGDTASNGRDGANGLTGKDGLNDKTLTEKVNALRNGEAGTVVYTDDAGERLVKANDGKYYHKDDLKADGTPKTADENNGTAPKAVDNPQARVVNANGDVKTATTLSNIADGKVAANSKDAVNGGQLNTVKSDLATALGGGAKVENGTFTGPTYNITKDDGSNTTEPVNNVGDAISKLDSRINNANTVLGNKGLDFYGNKDTADTDKVHRNLGEALKVKGAENFTREADAKNNIDVVKNTAGDGFDVKLAENLGNMKEIAGNGKDDLVIKNGDATITLKPKKEAEGTNPATPATVDFGNTKVVAPNLEASIKYRANDEAAANAKSVKLADGFNFVASTDTTTTAEGPKSGLAIKAEDNGKVTFGLDKTTREKVDNAADKNLSNLTDAGKNKVKELAGEVAKAAVTVADGINTTVTTDTATTGVTTYKVNANDTTVAVNADSLAIAGGDLDATTKVRAYTLDLSDTVKAKLNAINNVGDTASNGRDGVNGTSGATGLTGKDGLNDKTLTDKVNALRNGEAGSVVYTDENGARLVKAKDGEYYKAADVDKDGNVLNGATPATTVEARLVNPKGETTVPTKLSNIADGKVAAGSKNAVNGGQLHTVKSDLATALGGGAKVENGTFTGPTYNITKDDGSNTTEEVKNVGDAISKLDGRINNANTALGNKGLDFYGNKDTADTDKVHRNLGEALKVKGAENFTREANAKNNIDVVKNTAGDGFDVKLAENLGNMKEIAGNGKDNLVIKNGDATITLKPKKDAEGTNPATPATVDFGNTKVVAPNLEASITYRANSAEDADAKTVTLQKGLNFVSGDGTAATAEAARAGITIAADKDGKVVFGLNEATRNAIDNAADKNLSNLSQDGKDKVADLAKTAARDAVKVAAGNNVTVTPEIKDGNTTYTVSGRDTTVKAADNGSVSVTGGTLNAKGEREYTVDLTAEAKAELGKISDLNTRLGSAEGKITTLQGDMTKAKDDIANNAKHIEANKDLIEANKEAIATNKNAIAANTKDIETNTKDIVANRKDIDANTKDIAANRKDIDANKQGIAENKKQIGENTAAIGKNAENIKKNAQDIKNNTETIKSNTDRIQTVENRVTTAEGKIATNEKAIKDNASTIQSNTKAIGANTTAIAKNASDITKANKEIESLKGNSATKDLSNLTNTGKDTITNLINVTGEHGITVTPSTDTTTRVKTFTAKLNDTVTFGSGDKKITVDGTTGTVTSKAVAADTVKTNTVNAKTIQLGDSTGTNTTVTADGIAVTTKNPNGTTSKVEIKNGTVSGLTNTKWDPAKVVTEADRSVVATQGQVKDVTDTLARGRVFVGDTGKTVTVGLGDTLAIKGGATKALTDDNIGVVSTEAKDGKPATMTVKLAKDVKMKDGSTSYDYYLPEMKTNPDGSKEIIKNADGSVKHQLGKDGNPIRLVTTTVNGEGITIEPVKGLDKPTVSLTADGLDNGGNQIHNVAAGTLNTDAATVGQVRAAAHALNNRVNEAGAHAAALAAMNPLSYDPLKKSQVMAGVGSYKGNNALALGVAHYANEDTLFNVGIAVGDGSNMVNAGVTYRFGGEDSAVPERYKGGPISSVYVMQDEVSALKSENAEMKAQMKMLMERIEMLAAKA